MPLSWWSLRFLTIRIRVYFSSGYMWINGQNQGGTWYSFTPTSQNQVSTIHILMNTYAFENEIETLSFIHQALKR